MSPAVIWVTLSTDDKSIACVGEHASLTTRRRPSVQGASLGGGDARPVRNFMAEAQARPNRRRGGDSRGTTSQQRCARGWRENLELSVRAWRVCTKAVVTEGMRPGGPQNHPTMLESF